MNFIENIARERKAFGYNDKEFMRYSKHCKNMIKHHKKTTLTSSAIYNLFKAESEFTRHFLTESKKIKIKRVKKAIKFTEERVELEPFRMLYTAFLNCMLGDHRKAFEIANSSRSFFSADSIFLQDIDNLIFDCNKIDETLVFEKLVGNWHDIELSFESLSDSELFFRFGNLKFKSTNYENELKGFISRFEDLKSKFEVLAAKSPHRAECLYQKTKKLVYFTDKFQQFLSKNYASSQFVSDYYIGIISVNKFYLNIRNRNKGDMGGNEEIEDFKVPQFFCQDILNSKSVMNVDCKAVKSKLLRKLIDGVKIEEYEGKMPFLPVSYDLANDFIKYPNERAEKSGLSSFISKFSSFSFRK